MLLQIITLVVPYLHSIMHMHYYCYLTGELLSSWTGKVSGATMNCAEGAKCVYLGISLP